LRSKAKEEPVPRQTPTEFTQTKARAPGADFADYCCELLGSLGDVQAKRMFGGWGLSVEGLTMAIIAWDVLYLKANADTKPQFEAAGCEEFVYEAKGKVFRMAYYTTPEAALESRAAMQAWAQLALQAAVAARKPAKANKVSKTTKAAKLGPAAKTSKARPTAKPSTKKTRKISL
jgi:DNA transformation protein and related proteins